MTDNQHESRDFQEWKQCQRSINEFDRMILDIRKYGFSFTTLLLGANGFLLGQVTAVGAIGICSLLTVLIVALFHLDRMHEIYLRSAVLRAMQLEKREGLGLARCLSYFSEAGAIGTWGTGVYALLCFAAFALAGSAIMQSTSRVEGDTGHLIIDSLRVDTLPWLLVSAILMAATVHIVRYHGRTRLKSIGGSGSLDFDKAEITVLCE